LNHDDFFTDIVKSEDDAQSGHPRATSKGKSTLKTH
jgi:hypothetical protein